MSTTQPPPPAYAPSQRGNGLGVAGFVCGLLAAIFGLIPFLFFISFILGILGIFFSAIGWRRARRDPARGGKGLSIAGLILGLIGFVLAIAQVAIIGEAAEDLDDEIDELEREFDESP